jgi:hypothetical protein
VVFQRSFRHSKWLWIRLWEPPTSILFLSVLEALSSYNSTLVFFWAWKVKMSQSSLILMRSTSSVSVVCITATLDLTFRVLRNFILTFFCSSFLLTLWWMNI